MRRRLAVVLVIAAASATVVAWAVDRNEPRVSSSEQRRYIDRAGWSIAYPRTMHLERSEASMRLYVSEVTVASFPSVRAVRSGSTPTSSWLRIDPPQNRHGIFPDDGVAFRMFRREGGPGPNLEAPETRLPLRLSSFQRSSVRPRTNPQPVERTVNANGGTYVASAWIGPDAPAPLRASLARVVSSLSFPRLHAGQTAHRFRVLESATQYPSNSRAPTSPRAGTASDA